MFMLCINVKSLVRTGVHLPPESTGLLFINSPFHSDRTQPACNYWLHLRGIPTGTDTLGEEQEQQQRQAAFQPTSPFSPLQNTWSLLMYVKSKPPAANSKKQTRK